MFELVDMFIAPSSFLRTRYLEWGLPEERVLVEENGSTGRGIVVTGGDRSPLPSRLGFFGQLTRYKGIHVLLEAMQLLSRENTGAHLWVHGANLDLQSSEYQRQVADLLVTCGTSVTLSGRYEPEALPALMANVDWVVVPSIWWENSPLVIQEAFMHGRPVICSDIGGMAEKVKDEVNGLHFRVRDPGSLAEVLHRATTSPDLWSSLREGIPAVHRMEDHVAFLAGLYGRLVMSKRHSVPTAVVPL